jgi:hypothetical protein
VLWSCPLVKALTSIEVEDVHDATFWVEKYGLALVRVVASINSSYQLDFCAIELGSTVKVPIGSKFLDHVNLY